METIYDDGICHLTRPRITALLADAAKKPLFTVCAGGGCGKTRAASDFIWQHKIPAVWLQLSERDNSGPCFWDAFTGALTRLDALIADESKKTISLAILRLQVATAVKTEWGALFAACIMVILPVLAIYIFFQSKLTEGLTAGSLKG